jgi:hypothetical protein
MQWQWEGRRTSKQILNGQGVNVKNNIFGDFDQISEKQIWRFS